MPDFLKDEMLQLIIDRQWSIQRVLNLLEKKWGKVNWAAKRQGSGAGFIPKQGFLDSEQKIPYSFHGAGIYVDFEDEHVNFDFRFSSSEYSEEDHNEISADRVLGYLNCHKGKYQELEKLNLENTSLDEKKQKIQNVLKDLEKDRIIFSYESQNEFYLK